MMFLLQMVFLVEIVQVVAAAVGLGFTAFTVHDAWLDAEAVRISEKNGARKLVAAASLRMGWHRTILQVLFLVIGIVALCIPAPPGLMFAEAGPRLGWLILSNHGLFFIATLLLSGHSVTERIDRHALILAWKARQRRGLETIESRPSIVEPHGEL